MAPVEGDKKKQDAALADLNAGKAVKDVKADTTEIDIFAALQQGAMTDEQKAKLLAAGDEYFVLDSTDKGAAICKVIVQTCSTTSRSSSTRTTRLRRSSTTLPRPNTHTRR